ncbi:tetratricopeptide repeat protein [Roseivirga sp.]|uniref:tetratricopeptide repeat protein n=1 Tax=Roseivirga sp. TaxID=1964215 RepID=UPI003B8E185C
MLKKNQKEAEEKKLKAKRNSSFRKYRWIGFIVYPFFMLLPFLTANGQEAQHARLKTLLAFNFTAQHNAVPTTPLDLYYENLNDILQVILLENDDLFERLEKNKSDRLDKLDAFKNMNDPWYGFVKAEIKLQWAFVNFKFGNDWDTFWGLRSASKTINKQQKAFPDFQPNNRTLGALNVIFGNVPSQNQWLMKLFGLKGDVFEGISQLEKIDNRYADLLLESELIKAMIQSFLLEDYNKASGHIDQILSRGKSPLVNYVSALVKSKIHNSLDARQLLENSAIKFPFHDYLIAETHFQGQEYDKAITGYQKFLDAFQGNSYVKDAYLKIGMSHGLSGDLELYQKYLNLAKENGNEQSEIDKNAAKLIKDLPNQRPLSLKIRYAIDGGFYQRASVLIEELEAENISDYEKLELTYRKARINHLTGNYEAALTHYRTVIANAEFISETYYGPNSFLQAGYLMRQKGDKASALMYFQEVLNLKRHPYKASLDAKAKIAIERLNH